MSSSIYTCTGWHTQATLAREISVDSDQVSATALNIFKVLNYIPVVSTCTAYLEIKWTSAKIPVVTPSDISYEVARFVLNMLGLGIVFLIPDAIVSVHRHCCNSPNVITA